METSKGTCISIPPATHRQPVFYRQTLYTTGVFQSETVRFAVPALSKDSVCTSSATWSVHQVRVTAAHLRESTVPCECFSFSSCSVWPYKMARFIKRVNTRELVGLPLSRLVRCSFWVCCTCSAPQQRVMSSPERISTLNYQGS